jgi:Kef-type K+ transport system membrane component KefB
MVSDTLALVVFAICVPIYVSGFSVSGFAIQITGIVLFIPLVLVGMGRGGAYLLRKVEQDEEASFILMLGLLAVTALLAHAIHLPEFVGAFLARLAVNSAAKGNRAKGKLEFVGNTLFIPSFFIVTGFLIDPAALARTLAADSLLGVGIIAALVAGKWLAAEVMGRAFGYAPVERRTMWSLTLPQVATTLAATLVAHRTLDAAGQPLLGDQMLNAVLFMVLVTAILGPVLTQYFATRMLQMQPDNPQETTC